MTPRKNKKIVAAMLAVILLAACALFACRFFSADETPSDHGVTDASENDKPREHLPRPPHIPYTELPWNFTESKEPSEDDVPVNTVKNLLLSALEPVGNCLYVYGGGWNEEDTAAGIEALTYGVSPRWHEFFLKSDRSYDHRNHMYEIHNGLDCTGYVGYSLFQVFGHEYSNNGYVFASRNAANGYLSLFGGSVIPPASVKDRLPGDIMTKDGHVYLTIGECSDGSVLLMHASPPNVTLSGTPTPSGVSQSEAYLLAHEYMETIAPESHSRYENCSRGLGYLTEYSLYRFPEDVLADPDGYRNMTPSEIMADLLKSK